MSLVPTALRARRRRRCSTPWCSAGPAPPRDLPPNVVTTYGLTETGSGVVYDGVPLDGVEVAIDAATPRSGCGVRCCCGPTGTARRPLDGRRLARHRRRRLARTPTAGCTSTGRLGRPDHHRRRERLAGPGRGRPAPPSRGRRGRGRPAGPTRSGASGWWPGSFPPTRPSRPRSTELRAWSPTSWRPTPPPASWSSSTRCRGPSIGKVHRDCLPDPGPPP